MIHADTLSRVSLAPKLMSVTSYPPPGSNSHNGVVIPHFDLRHVPPSTLHPPLSRDHDLACSEWEMKKGDGYDPQPPGPGQQFGGHMSGGYSQYPPPPHGMGK
jgi:hypothetical protein